MLVMFEQPEGEAEEGQQEEENSFEVTEAIPDVELFGYRPTTRSINILSGAYVHTPRPDHAHETEIWGECPSGGFTAVPQISASECLRVNGGYE